MRDIGESIMFIYIYIYKLVKFFNLKSVIYLLSKYNFLCPQTKLLKASLTHPNT